MNRLETIKDLTEFVCGGYETLGSRSEANKVWRQLQMEIRNNPEAQELLSSMVQDFIENPQAGEELTRQHTQECKTEEYDDFLPRLQTVVLHCLIMCTLTPESDNPEYTQGLPQFDPALTDAFIQAVLHYSDRRIPRQSLISLTHKHYGANSFWTRLMDSLQKAA